MSDVPGDQAHCGTCSCGTKDYGITFIVDFELTARPR